MNNCEVSKNGKRKGIPGKDIPGKDIPGKDIPGKDIPSVLMMLVYVTAGHQGNRSSGITASGLQVGRDVGDADRVSSARSRSITIVSSGWWV